MAAKVGGWSLHFPLLELPVTWLNPESCLSGAQRDGNRHFKPLVDRFGGRHLYQLSHCPLHKGVSFDIASQPGKRGDVIFSVLLPVDLGTQEGWNASQKQRREFRQWGISQKLLVGRLCWRHRVCPHQLDWFTSTASPRLLVFRSSLWSATNAQMYLPEAESCLRHV